jgi:hypothetical protein
MGDQFRGLPDSGSTIQCGFGCGLKFITRKYGQILENSVGKRWGICLAIVKFQVETTGRMMVSKTYDVDSTMQFVSLETKYNQQYVTPGAEINTGIFAPCHLVISLGPGRSETTTENDDAKLPLYTMLLIWIDYGYSPLSIYMFAMLLQQKLIELLY